MPFPDFPPAVPSGYFSTNLFKQDSETGASLALSGSVSVRPEEREQFLVLMEELHQILTPLGWTIQGYETTDMQRQYEFPALEEPEPLPEE